MHPLETYLTELRDIRSTGAAVKETSYYPALANLLNEVGKTLKPKVRCVLTLKNRGAGIPDSGLFTPEQFQKSSDAEPLPGQNPARGVVEVKGTGDDAWVIASGAQVSKYWDKYRQVLVTNYRDFVLVGEDTNGKLIKLETYRLAESEAEFWAQAAHPHKMAEQHGERFIEYLKRVMLHTATTDDPQQVAWFLASYARDARARIAQSDLPALAALRAALEEALGIQFEGVKGEHFFRSTLVQTLFYGVFSAWVLWHKENPARADRFDWRTTANFLRVPMLASLFAQISMTNRLKPLGLVEVLDWTAGALNRVSRESFFSKFEEHHAVQYFYEPFLQAFDPELRKDLGVWYTPPEIVEYMVERVDRVLREELGIEEGFADSRVFVLDPVCGTATFVLAVLKRIAATLKDKGGDALAADDVNRAARERVFGFEILPAPFVISHLQIGLLLQNLGAPLGDNERAGVYLTNSLTGWEPTDPEKEKIAQLKLSGMPELKEEHDAADKVKHETPILVILGNPPYNAFAGTSPAEEQGLVEPYKAGLISEWGIKKFNLDELYVRFFRLAERRIAEKAGRGVVCYISNFSYLSDPSFVVMRQRFLSEFDSLWFDCLNGDSRETGKLTPEGKPDPSVFSTEYNHEGIRVGTAIGLMVRKEKHDQEPTVRFRHFWGVTKREDLLTSLGEKKFDEHYQFATPEKSNRYSFRPSTRNQAYQTWPKLLELGNEIPFVGCEECRGGALIDIDKENLIKRMQKYLDGKYDWEEIKGNIGGLAENSAGFDAKIARTKMINLEHFDKEHIVRFTLRPFDTRWAYYSLVSPLWNRPRPSLRAQTWQGNQFLISRLNSQAKPEGVCMYLSSNLFDKQTISRNPGGFPILLRATKQKSGNSRQTSFIDADTPIANLSPAARAYLATLGIINPDAEADTAALVWMHALAIGYSPAYLKENADGIRQDWPRIPLPDSKKALLASAELGKQIAALLDTETQVKGVTTGAIQPEFKDIAAITRVGGGALKPENDLKVTAGWGHGGKDGVTMPGKGKIVERKESGKKALDVYLNDVAYWKNIPESVWEYTIGGYQVIKKWLSYREFDLLGRALTADEAREVMNMARRIAAIIALESALDANYKAIKKATYKWQG